LSTFRLNGKKVFRWLVYVVLLLVIVVSLLWLALQMPAVQNRMIKEATDYLSEKVQTPLSIDHIEIDFFSRLVLEGIYVEDLRGDTLLYAGSLKASLSLFAPLQQQVGIKGIQLNDAVVNLHRGRDSIFNFQFLVDAFSSDTPKDTTAAKGPPWQLGLEKLQLNAVRFTLLDSLAAMALQTNVTELKGTLHQLDLASQTIAVSSLSLKNASTAYTSWATRDTTQAPPTASSLTFPYTGWQLEADHLTLEDVHFTLDDQTQAPAPPNTFDPAHMAFRDIALTLEDFSWTPTILQGDIGQLAFREKNGFELQECNTHFELSNQGIQLQALQLNTPNSNLEPSSLALTFSDFNDLSNFVHQVFVDVDLQPTTLALSDLEYWAGPIPALDAWQSQTIQIDTRFRGTVPQLTIDQLNGQIGKRNRIALNGTITGLPDVKTLIVDINLQKAITSYSGLKELGIDIPTGVQPFGQLRLNAAVRGPIDTLQVQKLNLTTDQYTAFEGDITAYGLPQPDSLRFDIAIADLRTQASDLRGFLNDTIPPPLAALGQLQYQGRLTGTPLDLTLDGLLRTAVGQVREDVQIQFTTDYQNADYDGQIAVNNLALGQILDNPQLGQTTLRLQAKGRGLALDSLQTKLEATVQQFDFNGYVYQNLSLAGRMDARQFEGQCQIKDDNLSFSLDGLVNLRDSLPDFQFTATLDTANLQALNLYPTPLHLETKMDLNLRGNQIDNLEGQAALTDFFITDKRHEYATERILLSAQASPAGQRNVRLQSDILAASLSGRYQVSRLQPLLLGMVDDLFSMAPLVDTSLLADTLLDDDPQQFDLQVQLTDPTRLTNIFTPQLQKLDTAWLDIAVDSKTGKLDLAAFIPSATISNLTIDSLRLTTTSNKRHIHNTLSVQAVQSNAQLAAANLQVIANLEQDSLYLSVTAGSDRDQKDDRLDLQAVTRPYGQSDYAFKLLSPLAINKALWQIPADNMVRFGENPLYVRNMDLRRKGQTFYAQSQGPEDSDRFEPLYVGFKDIRLRTLAILAGQDTSMLSGTLNGGLTLSQPDTNLIYDIDLTVPDLVLAQKPLGGLTIKAKPDAALQQLGVNIGLAGEKNELALRGKYGLEDNALDFNLDMSKLQLAVLDFFSQDNIKNSRGRIAAQLDITGNLDAPVVTGYTRFENASTFVNYLKTRFVLPAHQIDFRPAVIDIGTMQLKDIEGHPATLSGQIRHQHFKNIDLDLGFDSPSLLVLNTQAKDNELFYGKLNVSAYATIEGAPDAPKISVRTKTLKNTKLTAVPLAGQRSIARESFIIYDNPNTVNEDTTAVVRSQYQTTTKGLDIDLRLDLTPDATIIAVIDPETGDQLQVRGDANLLVEMDPNGQLRTTGDILITEGSYAFNFQGLAKRNFTIQSGSHIYLPGDPLDARFDITAIYTVRTSVFDLISNQLNLDPAQEAAARRRQNIKVLMNIKGTLEQPAITFQIEPGDNMSGSIAEAVSRRLTQLQEQESELNKQVLGLLLFNGFIATSSGSTNLTDAGQNIALQSVSSFLTQQLNTLADQYVEGFDLSFGLESYNTSAAENVTEVQLGVSKQLFDDRLSVQVGGNLGVNENSTNTTTIAGSFLLEYKLTDDGRYRVRVFRRPDTDIFTEGIRTGAGLIYKKTFGNIQVDTTKTTPAKHE
jgi:hypothetical protein